MQKIHFVAFGSKNRFTNTLNRIINEAENTNIFDRIHRCSEDDLDDDFMKEHSDFILKNTRGFGYWIWKSQIVYQTLKKMDDNDILIYADAGCTIRNEPQHIKRIMEYIDIVNKSEYANLGFQMGTDSNTWRNNGLGGTETIWTKRELLEYMNFTADEDANTGQIVGGLFVLRKTPFVEKLIYEWKRICSNHNLINDACDKSIQHPLFREHRHDQSIFSILRKKMGCEVVHLREFETKIGSKYPFIASRLR